MAVTARAFTLELKIAIALLLAGCHASVAESVAAPLPQHGATAAHDEWTLVATRANEGPIHDVPASVLRAAERAQSADPTVPDVVLDVVEADVLGLGHAQTAYVTAINFATKQGWVPLAEDQRLVLVDAGNIAGNIAYPASWSMIAVVHLAHRDALLLEATDGEAKVDDLYASRSATYGLQRTMLAAAVADPRRERLVPIAAVEVFHGSCTTTGTHGTQNWSNALYRVAGDSIELRTTTREERACDVH